MAMNKVRCKQIVDNFKDDIQIEYEVNDEVKIFRVTSLSALGTRVVHEEYAGKIENHKAINNAYLKARELYDKLINEYYGKFHNRVKEDTKE